MIHGNHYYHILWQCGAKCLNAILLCIRWTCPQIWTSYVGLNLLSQKNFIFDSEHLFSSQSYPPSCQKKLVMGCPQNIATSYQEKFPRSLIIGRLHWRRCHLMSYHIFSCGHCGTLSSKRLVQFSSISFMHWPFAWIILGWAAGNSEMLWKGSAAAVWGQYVDYQQYVDYLNTMLTILTSWLSKIYWVSKHVT